MKYYSQPEPILTDYLSNRPLPFNFLCSGVSLVQEAEPSYAPTFHLTGRFVQRDPIRGSRRKICLTLDSGPAAEVRKILQAGYMSILRSKVIRELIADVGTVEAIGPDEGCIAKYIGDALRCHLDRQDIAVRVTAGGPFERFDSFRIWEVTVMEDSGAGTRACTLQVTDKTPLLTVFDDILRFKLAPAPAPAPKLPPRTQPAPAADPYLKDLTADSCGELYTEIVRVLGDTERLSRALRNKKPALVDNAVEGPIVKTHHLPPYNKVSEFKTAFPSLCDRSPRALNEILKSLLITYAEYTRELERHERGIRRNRDQ